MILQIIQMNAARLRGFFQHHVEEQTLFGNRVIGIPFPTKFASESLICLRAYFSKQGVVS